MLIWIVVIIVALLATICCVIKCSATEVLENKKAFTKQLTVLLLSMAILLTAVITIVNTDAVAVKSADLVALIYKHEPGGHQNRRLFYDNEADEYFVVEYDPINIFHLSKRKIIDHAMAEKYIEAYNELKSFNFD